MQFHHRVLRYLGACALAAALVPAAGAAPSAPPTDPARQAALQRVKSATQGVAASHMKMNLECSSCHGPKIVLTDNLVTENAACVQCHGGYDKLGPATAAKAKNKDINAHASHLGPEIACTTCHSAHAASTSYCVNCHTNFDMPMPGNKR